MITEDSPIKKSRERADSISSNPDPYLLTDMDFKDVQIYSKRPNKENQVVEASEFTLASEFVTLCFLYIFICQLYVIAYLMLDKMGGDIYVVGIVLSLAEGISSLGSGFAMKYISDLNVVRCSLIMCVVFNLIYYYYMGP